MNAQTNKELFIQLLTTHLQESPDKQTILDLAGTLIPSDDARNKTDPVDSPVLQKAVRVYQKSHPKYRKIDPPLDLAIDWLLKRGGILYAESLEKRLDRIHEIMVSLGYITIDEATPVAPMQIITLRVLSDLNPSFMGD